MSISNNKTEMFDLIEFISTYEEIEGGKRLFKELDTFLQEKLNSSPLLVYSVPKDLSRLGDKDVSDFCRLLWNKSEVGDEYHQDVIRELLLQVTALPRVRGWKSFVIDGENYHYFYLGENETQAFFGLTRPYGNIGESTLDYLGKFLLSQARRMHEVHSLRKLESLVHVDDVTGLYNQRKLLKDLEEAINRFEDFQEEFTVLFIDIDHFKNVNDGHGHLVGTQLLSDMAILLKRVLRESDLIYRYGGDEFVMIIRDVSADVASIIGDRILKAVESTEFDVREKKDINKEGGTFQLSVSIGIAGYPRDAHSRDDILAMADRMMYQAKESGRGRVCQANDMFDKNNVVAIADKSNKDSRKSDKPNKSNKSKSSHKKKTKKARKKA